MLAISKLVFPLTVHLKHRPQCVDCHDVAEFSLWSCRFWWYRGMQTGLITPEICTGIRDQTIGTGDIIQTITFRSAWWRTSCSDDELNLKAQLSLWPSWPAVKVNLLIKASLSLSYLLALPSSSLLSTHSLSTPPRVSSPWVIYNGDATGIPLLLRDILQVLFPIFDWSVMTKVHQEFRSGTFIV